MSMGLLLGYLALGYRVYRKTRIRGFSSADAWLYAIACVVSKFPQASGQLRYWRNRLTGKRSALIEYKGPVLRAQEARGNASR
jgi:hypothetical protein